MSLALPASFDLTGKVVLVTGGAGLLGRQHAAALAAVGATVVVSDLSLEATTEAVAALKQELPEGDFHAATLDVTSEQDAARLQSALTQRFGGVDVLVNNAAIDPKVSSGPGVVNSSRLEAFPLDQWKRELDVGLTGAMICSKHFGSAMAARGRGAILNIASDLAVISPDQRLYRNPDVIVESEQPVKPVTYSVIKHGLVGLTKYLATYWADQGVRVNALSPGGVFNGQSEAFVDRLRQRIPMDRMAERSEYRSAVQFLCSDASSYMTGQNIVIDGGRSVW